MIRAVNLNDAPAILDLWNIAIRDTLITFNSVEKTHTEVTHAQTKEHSIMLREDTRRAGMGRALMTALENEARVQGVHTLVAGISASNTVGEPFHAALGFVTVGHIKQAGWKFDQWHDLVLMQKIL